MFTVFLELCSTSTSLLAPLFYSLFFDIYCNSSQFCSLFPYSCSFLPNAQIPHSCSSFYFLCLPPWHMGYIAQTLPFDWGILLLYLFFPLLPLEQVLPKFTIGGPLASLAKLEAMVLAAIVSLHCSTLELVLHYIFASSASLLLSCFPSNSYLEQLLYHTITQLSLADILLPSTFSVLFHLFFFWILPPTVSLHIYFLLLLSWIPIWTSLLFFLSALISSTLLLSLISHLLLQTLSWYLPKILLHSHILVILPPSPPACFLSRYLPILPTYMIVPTVFALLLVPLSFSSIYTACML